MIFEGEVETSLQLNVGGQAGQQAVASGPTCYAVLLWAYDSPRPGVLRCQVFRALLSSYLHCDSLERVGVERFHEANVAVAVEINVAT
ncbi:MAG: hypothetical protein EBR49_11805 [Betaproteobacteria bacterium]|nr:hypothetical protein [Betaproteobacteria bacterium]